MIFQVKEFIIKHKEIIALVLLDFDHIPEDELRKRNILNPNETYEGKINCVSMLKKKEEILKEIKKCQIVCSKCHLLTTMKREKGTIIKGERKIKSDYVNEIKKMGVRIVVLKMIIYLDFLNLII